MLFKDLTDSFGQLNHKKTRCSMKILKYPGVESLKFY